MGIAVAQLAAFYTKAISWTAEAMGAVLAGQQEAARMKKAS